MVKSNMQFTFYKVSMFYIDIVATCAWLDMFYIIFIRNSHTHGHSKMKIVNGYFLLASAGTVANYISGTFLRKSDTKLCTI